MEGTTNTLRQLKTDLDDINAGIMPESWEGHARLAIRQSEIVPESIEEKAINKAISLAKEKDAKPEAVANKIIKQVAEKRGD